MRLSILFLISSCLVAVTLGQLDTTESQKNTETLVIVDKSANLVNFSKEHSSFLQLIKDLGHSTTIKSADDSTLKLIRYGEFIYDNIVLFCPQGDAIRSSSLVREILEFVDAGRNVLIVGSNKAGSRMNEIARGVGFEFKESAAKRDYSNSKLNQIFHLVGDVTGPFSFSGTQLKMLKSELTREVLINNAPVDDIRPTTGSKFTTNVLIGAMQARNNARVIVSGSAEFFSDKAYESSGNANKKLSNELLKWVTKEKSLLRYTEVRHRKLNADNNQDSQSTDIATKTNFEGYTIMDEIEYKIKIEIYENNQWKPYVADDVQLEFVRIDPFVRQTMKANPDGTYLAKFKVPDVYGVYKFQVDYNNDGLTHLFSTTQVSVRPLRHNEYERYIFSAYPYYLSAFMMMIYLYIFSFVHFYQKKDTRNNK